MNRRQAHRRWRWRAPVLALVVAAIVITSLLLLVAGDDVGGVLGRRC